MLEQRRTPARVDPPSSGLYRMTSLPPSASLAEAIGAHWREYLAVMAAMEALAARW